MTNLHTKGISKLAIIIIIALLALALGGYTFLGNAGSTDADSDKKMPVFIERAPTIVMPPSAGVTVNMPTASSTTTVTSTGTPIDGGE